MKYLIEVKAIGLDLLELDPKKKDHQQTLFLLCREGLDKAAIESFHEHVQAVNRFMVGAILQSEDAVKLIRRELRRVSPETRVSMEEIEELLPEVLRRDLMEGKEAEAAQRRVKRASARKLRKVEPTPTDGPDPAP